MEEPGTGTLNPLVPALDPTAGPSLPSLEPWRPGDQEKPLQPLRHGHTWDRWVPLKTRGPATGSPPGRVAAGEPGSQVPALLPHPGSATLGRDSTQAETLLSDVFTRPFC